MVHPTPQEARGVTADRQVEQDVPVPVMRHMTVGGMDGKSTTRFGAQGGCIPYLYGTVPVMHFQIWSQDVHGRTDIQYLSCHSTGQHLQTRLEGGSMHTVTGLPQLTSAILRSHAIQLSNNMPQA